MVFNQSGQTDMGTGNILMDLAVLMDLAILMNMAILVILAILMNLPILVSFLILFVNLSLNDIPLFPAAVISVVEMILRRLKLP